MRCRLHHAGNRRASCRHHLARCIRAAAFDAEHGEAARWRRLLSVGSESVLSSGQVANLGRRVEGELRERTAEAQTADELNSGRRHRRERRACTHRVARHAEAGRSQQEDRHAGLLHGRRARGEDGGRSTQSRGRGRLIPRRRPRHARIRTARICSHRRSRRGCTSASRPTTTCSSPMPRRS